MSRAPLRVAVLGAGTVGREVVRAFLEWPERLLAHDGSRLELTGVAVRDVERARAAGVPAGLLTDAPAHLVASPDVDLIVELIGGDEPAHTLIRAALGAGKPVVTANKHVLAHHGPELESIARRTGAGLRFEAAVAGGIPVLGPLAAELATNRVTRVRGIVNGTTNYILSAMSEAGRPYAEVLADAQAAGYAEADPTGDVEGDDAANKLVILIRLAFGAWVRPEAVVRRPSSTLGEGQPGIIGVSAEAISAAASLDSAIKLVVDARLLDDGRIAASVLPTLLPLADPLARTNGVTNRVEVRAEPLGNVALVGPGAGGGPTSSAVLGDLVAIARGGGSTWAGLAPAGDRSGDRLVGPPDEAHDRGWFAVVPGAKAVAAGSPGTARSVPVPGGTAVHVRGIPLAAMRALVAAAASEDTTIYPADERAVRR